MTIRIAVLISLLAGGLPAQEDALKQRVQARSQAVVEMLTSGLVTEGTDGLLKPVGQLEPPQRQTMQEENQDREAIFQLIAEKSGITLDEVRQMYSARAKMKFPPPQAPPGPPGCKLTPGKPAETARLLQYLKQGMNYASQKQFDNALAEFQPALAIDKNFLNLNLNVGAAQMSLKKYAEAEAAFRAEVKLVDCLAAMNDNQLGAFGYYFEVEEKDAAKRRKAQTEKLKAALPGSRANAHYNLACALARLNQKDQALSELKAAVEAGPVSKQNLNADPDLAAVRSAPEFRDIVARAK